MSDSSESDIEIKSAPLPKISRKPPPSPTDDLKNKKITTKMMIIDALTELKTRKGVSLYAIKKYLTEKYNINTEKINYLIKKSIKAGVQDGTFVQIKGIGASGSFKLANKEKPKKKKEKVVKEKTEKKISKKPKKMDVEKIVTEKTKTDSKEKKIKIKETKDKEKPKKKATETAEKKPKKIVETEKKEKKTTKDTKGEKKKKVKIGTQTPAKKRAAMMKRKSIGSIIKPPKMKPKLQA